MIASDILTRLKPHLETELADICRAHPVRAVIAELDAAPAIMPLEEPCLIVRKTADRISAEHGPQPAGKYCKLVVLTLLADFEARIARIKCPQSVLDLYQQAIPTALDSMATMTDVDYMTSATVFLKDLRLAAQLSLPCGAQAVDFRAWLPKTFYRNNGLSDNLSALWFLVTRLGGRGPLFRIHTDTRALSDFNERGWTACYLRIAELLALYPEMRGVVGTSWFFDPQLETVSPHLGYLRKLPQDNGAFLRDDGESEGNTALALSTSQTRRKLYDEGRYRPRCQTLVWARRDLLAWAGKQTFRLQDKGF